MDVRNICERLTVLANAEIVISSGSNVLAYVRSKKGLLSKISHALSELQDNASIFNQLHQNSPVAAAFFDELSALLNFNNKLLAQLDPLLINLGGVALPFLTQSTLTFYTTHYQFSLFTIGESNLLGEAESHFSQISTKISEWQQNQPLLSYLFSPFQTWLGKQQIVPLQQPRECNVFDGSELDLLLNGLLVSVQSLVSRCSDPVDAESDKDEDSQRYITKGISGRSRVHSSFEYSLRQSAASRDAIAHFFMS